MKRPTPEEYLAQHSHDVHELDNQICQQLCQQWEQDYDECNDDNPHSAACKRLLMDARMLQVHHCRCTPI